VRSPARSRGFTLVEILIVVVIIAVVAAGVVLSVNLTGRDRELEKESDRLLGLVNYAREQAELQTRDYGVLFHDDGYQFVTYDRRRQLWREVYEDDILRVRKLPYGLAVKLIVDQRPVVLVPTGDIKKPDPNKDGKPKIKSLSDLKSLDDVTAGHKLGDDPGSGLGDQKPPPPQVMIYANGDLTHFEVTLEREGGIRSITVAQDEKGQVIQKPLVENRS
jgi:type II secretion system protein H